MHQRPFASFGTTASHSHFADLEIAAADVTVTSSMAAVGSVTVSAAVTVSGAGLLRTLGSFTTVTGSAVTLMEVELGGAMSIGGTFSPATTEFFGTSLSVQAGLSYQRLIVTGSVSLTGATAVSGDLTIGGAGTLSVGDQTLTVSGDLTVAGQGLMVMTDAAGAVDVAGNVLVQGRNSNGSLTAGTLYVAGDFTQQNGRNGCCISYPANFSASGTHKVVLDGASAQTVTFASFGTTASHSHFADLEIAAADVTVTSSMAAVGSVVLSGSLTVQSGVTLELTANLSLEAAANLVNNGTINVAGSCTDSGATVTGTGGGNVACVVP